MSQQCALAAKKANSILGRVNSILGRVNRSIGNRLREVTISLYLALVRSYLEYYVWFRSLNARKMLTSWR